MKNNWWFCFAPILAFPIIALVVGEVGGHSARLLLVDLVYYIEKGITAGVFVSLGAILAMRSGLKWIWVLSGELFLAVLFGFFFWYHIAEIMAI